MAHSNVWDVTKPLDTELEGKGDDYIRQILLDLKERLAIDHNMDGILDTSLPTADGYHAKVTLVALSSDPALLTKSVTISNITNGTDAVVTTSSVHGLSTGDAITLSTTGALPTGLVAGTVYYVKVISTTTFYLCATYAYAIAGTNYIDTSSSGSGTHTLTEYLNGVMYAKADGVYFRNASGIVKVI